MRLLQATLTVAGFEHFSTIPPFCRWIASAGGDVSHCPETPSRVRTTPSKTLLHIVANCCQMWKTMLKRMLQSMLKTVLKCRWKSVLHCALHCVLHDSARGVAARRRFRRYGSRMHAKRT